MLKITVQKLGDTSVLRCHGRIVAGDAGSILRNAVLSQRHSRMLVIDLARVERIDAGGLGVLLSLRELARSSAITFKLMNATKRVEEILELTHLQRVFEFCSVRELFACCTAQRLCHPAQPINTMKRMKMTTGTVPWNGPRFRPSKALVF
jgi:anti-sigma B factor antagonist